MSEHVEKPDPSDAGAGELPPQVPPPTMTARLASVVLLLEAFCVFFATLVGAAFLPDRGIGRGWVWGVGLALVVVCVLAGGAVRRPRGIAVGTGVQVLLVATGAAVPAMLVVGLGFGALWWWLVSIGRRVDTDRRRWAEQAAAGQPLT